MEKLLMIVDLAKCVGCFNCLMACKDEHVDNRWLPYTDSQQKHGQKWIDPTRHERGKAPYTDLCFVTRMCQHCDEPHCQKAFPGAVDKRGDGIVLIDPNYAKGNRELVDSCPYGMISWNEELNTAQKCTMCAHLLDSAWTEPRCVQACPLRALSVIKADEETIEQIIEDQCLKPLTDGSNKPRVLYKNLERYTNNFIAGALTYMDGKIEMAAAGAGVRLTLNGTDLLETETDFFGEFKLDHLPDDSGTFQIFFTLDGYKPLETEVTIEKESVCLEPLQFVKK